ncbi:GerAB/ArcD/ProY family transporter [Ectobacillus funiculus]|uniref:GerAB/ArcD/ProY family transporter n=1 Tax=Ectobacillus funiculus TaxID=137993 RepID=A0ABV5WKW3_9BACI
MNRYFYYLVIVNMIANIVASVPRILIEARARGAIASMVLALFLGCAFIYIMARFFHSFPGKGLPELLKEHISKWIYIPFVLYLIAAWFLAGLVTLITYSFLLKRFLTPDMPVTWIICIFLCFISFGVLMNTKSVLYTIEAIVVFNIPLVILIMIKAYTGEGMKWDFVKKSVMYIYPIPDYSAFSACSYVFLGAANLIIFNRVFTKKQKMSWLQLGITLLIAGGNLATTYFIPIGYNGFDQIDRLVYPWILTSDSMRIEFGFVERVLFIFLVLYLAISFLSILIHWHVTVELLKSLFWLKRFQWKGRNLTPYLFVSLFWFISLIIVPYVTEQDVTVYTMSFFNILPFFFIVVLAMLWVIKRRAKT